MKNVSFFGFLLASFCFQNSQAQPYLFGESLSVSSIAAKNKIANETGNGKYYYASPTSTAPIDGGIAVLLVAGIVCGFKMVRERQQEARKVANG